MSYTITEIAALPTAEIVAFYNTLAAKPVKKFETRAVAIARTSALIASQEVVMNTVIEAPVEQVVATPATRIALDASDVAELPTITDLERLILAGVAESDFQDGHDPEDCKLVWSFSVTTYLSSKKSAGGVIASLVKKGLLSHEPKNGDSDECVAFTKLGAQVFRATVQTQALPVVGKAPKAPKAAKKIALDASDPVKAAKAPKAPKAEKAPKAPSKVEIMFTMIQAEGGALKSELLKICGWKGCAVALKRSCEKAGMVFEQVKIEGDWNYKAVAKA